MTTPSDKETSIEKDSTSPSLLPPPITSTCKAKDTKEKNSNHSTSITHLISQVTVMIN